MLTDVVTFAEPIPIKGMQGLWELPGWAVLKVNAAVVEAALAAIEAVLPK